MIFFGVVIGILIVGAMIYLALDKKSNLQTRIASLAALGIMIITVLICVFLILSDNRVPIDPSSLIVGAPVEAAEDGNSLLGFFLSIIFLLALFIVIAYLAMKEQRKGKLQKKD